MPYHTYPKIRSISSKVFPFVSGRKKITKSPPIKHQALKKMKVPQRSPSSIGGVTNATAKLFIQFEDALMEVPLARIDNGKISAIKVQLPGPHENAKQEI